ncbi:zn-finger domain-containing protein [Gigaspora margarita]|uniref:Zn-finger domain-containing protein n=1 Tax=Gigaspora margarita TaxID=4874 RepID=A0A8H4A7E0_GIGMA|nr:zn-finger domain-containing protein [Gigaspora margarita]
MNIYEATVIDRMHYLDLGLFKHQINFTCSLLKEKYGASILDTIDNRIANISRFLEFKIFKNSIQSLAKITANENRNLMKIIIFVLDNLDIDKSIQNKLLKLYEDWNNISASKLKFPKLYLWVYYTTDLIKKYGCLNRFSTETYESLHKDFVKTLYYLSNKQNIEDQIMKMEFIDHRLKNYRPNSKLYFGSVTLKNRSIIRTTDNFYEKAWYSNVAVAINPKKLLEYLTDEGICYRQIYLLIKVETAEENVDNLALIQ